MKDKLLLVEKWARDGLTEAQICKNLDISTNTMDEYKKNHPEFLVALEKDKEVLITEIENALIKRALGFEYDETKTYIKIENGKKVTYTEKTKKYCAPDTVACALILKNKDKENWFDNPQVSKTKKEMTELQRQALNLKGVDWCLLDH